MHLLWQGIKVVLSAIMDFTFVSFSFFTLMIFLCMERIPHQLYSSIFLCCGFYFSYFVAGIRTQVFDQLAGGKH